MVIFEKVSVQCCKACQELDDKNIEMFFERSNRTCRGCGHKIRKNLSQSFHIVRNRAETRRMCKRQHCRSHGTPFPSDPNPLLSYLLKIVRNISLKIYWRKEAAKRSSHYTIALRKWKTRIADQKNIEEEIEVRELACIIESFLDTLTIENRVIFMRRYWFSTATRT